MALFVLYVLLVALLSLLAHRYRIFSLTRVHIYLKSGAVVKLWLTYWSIKESTTTTAITSYNFRHPVYFRSPTHLNLNEVAAITTKPLFRWL